MITLDRKILFHKLIRKIAPLKVDWTTYPNLTRCWEDVEIYLVKEVFDSAGLADVFRKGVRCRAQIGLISRLIISHCPSPVSPAITIAQKDGLITSAKSKMDVGKEYLVGQQ